MPQPSATSNSSNGANAEAATPPPKPAKIEVPKWIPCTNRLDKDFEAEVRAHQPISNPTASQTAALCDDAPLLLFTELPPHSVEQKAYTERIKPGTVQYGVPPSIKLPNIDSEADAAAQLAHQLFFFNKKIKVEDIQFFKKNKQTIVNIKWPATFASNTPLKIDGIDIIYFGSASPIEANQITSLV